MDNEYDFGGLGRTKMNLDGPMWNWTDLWYKYTFLIRSVKIVIFLQKTPNHLYFYTTNLSSPTKRSTIVLKQFSYGKFPVHEFSVSSSGNLPF